LLLLTNEEMHDPGMITGKLFEYLGAGRPILALAMPGEASRILEETRAGVAVPPRDAPSIANLLERLFFEWKRSNPSDPAHDVSPSHDVSTPQVGSRPHGVSPSHDVSTPQVGSRPHGVSPSHDVPPSLPIQSRTGSGGVGSSDALLGEASRPDREAVARYSRPAQAERLAEALDAAVNEARSPASDLRHD
jgi:hypothetical protein